jgi:hypothetical protein
MSDHLLVNNLPLEVQAELADIAPTDCVLPYTIRLTNHAIFIEPKGYGDAGSADGCGCPIVIELERGRLRVHLFDDIFRESPTTIDLEGAREALRPGS